MEANVTFRTLLTEGLVQLAVEHRMNLDEFNQNLDDILEQLKSKKPTLPRDVALAAKIFKTKEDQLVIARWAKSKRDLTEIDDTGQNPLHIAAANGHPNLVKWLLKYIDVNLCAADGDSALMKSIKAVKDLTNDTALRNKYINIIEILLNAGAKNVAEPKHIAPKSAMGLVALYGDLQIMKMFVNHGFSVNEGDLMSPLAYAEHSRIQNHDLIAYLKQQGAK